MAQPVYPTLARTPQASSFQKWRAFDPTERTALEDGAYLVMATLTAVPWFWAFEYVALSAADRTTLLTFYADDANFGAVPIKFTDPTDSTAYFVRFAGPPQCQQEERAGIWRVKISFIEAIGTYT